VGTSCADHATPSTRKQFGTSFAGRGCRSVGVVRLRTDSHGVAFHHEDVGEWRYSSTIFDLSTRWRGVVACSKRDVGTYRKGGCVGPRVCMLSGAHLTLDRNRTREIQHLASRGGGVLCGSDSVQTVQYA
jgi:hypothetical protein